MHEREILLRWLDRGTARLRRRHGLDTLTTMAAVVAACLVLQQLGVALLPAAVSAALLPLLILLGLSGCLIVAWQRRRPPSTQDAARAADAQIGLQDTLRSAHWFSADDPVTPQVGLLLQRSARAVQDTTPRRALARPFPFVSWLALALFVVAALLTQLPRRSASHGDAVDGPASRTSHALPADAQRAAAPAAIHAGDMPPPARRDEAGSVWSRLAALSAALPDDDRTVALRAAITAQDKARAKAILDAVLEQLAREEASPAPAKDEVSAEVARGILDRLSALLADSGGPTTVEARQDTPNTGRITQQLREQMREPQAGGSDQAPEQNALDAALRAISRQNYGQRQTAGGHGEAGDEGGPAHSTGGAMGRRVGVSRAGAGGDERRPDGNPTGTAEAEPVLGMRTARLATQLQKVQVPKDLPDEDDGSEESHFAATRSQSAEAAYSAVQAVGGRASEAPIAQESLPPDYREATRRYTLSQHMRDAVARRRAAQADER